MADNVVVTAGAGTTIAADEIVDGTLGTVKVQYVKVMDGTIDGTTKLVVNSAGGYGTTPSFATVSSVGGAPAAVAVKASAGTLCGVKLFNHAVSERYLKIYNTASGGVTVGVTAPVFTVGISPGAARDVVLSRGLAFGTAISYAITALVGDGDTTVVVADDVKGIIEYV